jgi:hypothetical protein
VTPDVKASKEAHMKLSPTALAVVITAAAVTSCSESGEPSATEIARGYADAHASLDADQAITYLADDVLAAEWGSADQLRLHYSFLDALSAKNRVTGCEERERTAAGVVVRCTSGGHFMRSDELGLGPYDGDYQDLTVRDGKIVAISSFAPLEPFSSQVWEPFRRWVSSEHPDDVAVMFDGGGWRISEESIPLWNRRLREYVEVKTEASS